MKKTGFLAVLSVFLLSVGLQAGPEKIGSGLLRENPTADERWYQQEVFRDYPLRSLGDLELSNRRGKIHVSGWVQDRIRIRAVKRVLASSVGGAQKRFQTIELEVVEQGGQIRLSAQYGVGLEIKEKLRERRLAKAEVDLYIQAPAGLPLRIWGVDQEISIDFWKAPILIRSTAGEISIKNVKSSMMTVACQSCDISGEKLSGEIRFMGGTGRVQVKKAKAKSLFVETTLGNIELEQVAGKQVLVTKHGRMKGVGVSGRVEFQSLSGDVIFEKSTGFASGSTISGKVRLEFLDWTFHDRAFFETRSGDIQLRFPSGFSGEVDLNTQQGELFVEFPLLKNSGKTAYGPEPINIQRGQIGERSDQLKVSSQLGSIWILKGP